MGVPSFYRWLARKYQYIVVDCVEEKPKDISGNPIPVDTSQPNPNGQEFDNLYLDMNGIIHPCTHPPENMPQPQNEQDMMDNICAVLDRLFAIVRPRKLLYLAVDGVAPRAKMNQQRARRFRAAQEAEENALVEQRIRQELIAAGKDAPPPKDHSFDSNVITPGTEFMKRVSETLMRYTTEKLANDPGWKGVAVMISDASVPGEGEHKIMDYIRKQRAQPNYDPNIKHVICGLDADLIMLGLATHEPHFSILREEVMNMNLPPDACHKCNGRGHKAFECDAEPSIPEGGLPYQFLHLSVLREHLELEYGRIIGGLEWFDLERLIDDFILMCFLVGNDFLPHLPTLEIREGAIDVLMGLYQRILPTMGGYMTTGKGDVDFTKVQMLIAEVAVLEDGIFQKRKKRQIQEKERDRRREQQQNRDRKPGFGSGGDDGNKGRSGLGFSSEGSGFGENNTFNRAAAKALRESFVPQGVTETGKRKRERDGDDDNTAAEEPSPSKKQKGEMQEKPEEEEDVVKLGEVGYHERYYQYKFKVDIKEDPSFVKQVCKDYAEGIAWVFKYYYVGCSSWGWYFPHHYAPFAKDLAKYVGEFKFTFTLGTPFQPFEQLMSVLPAKSCKALPKPYHKYMGVGGKNFESPILHLYPKDFKLDMNGKKFAHQAVILLPFLDEQELLSTIKPVEKQLSPEETLRNTHGNHILVVNTSHPIAAQLALAEKSDNREVLNPAQGGMFGSVAKLGKLQLSNFGHILNSASENLIAVVFYDPQIPADFQYAGKLLPGLTPPTAVLPTAHLRQGEYNPSGQNSAAIRMINHSLGDNQHKPDYNRNNYGYSFNAGQNGSGYIGSQQRGGHQQHHQGGRGGHHGVGNYGNVPPPPMYAGGRGGFGGRGGGYGGRGGGYGGRGGFNDNTNRGGFSGYNNNDNRGYNNNQVGGYGGHNDNRGGYGGRGGHRGGFNDNNQGGGYGGRGGYNNQGGNRGGYNNNRGGGGHHSSSGGQQQQQNYAANYNPFAGRR